MSQSILRLASVTLLALGIALAGSSAANAETVMKMCGDQWKAAKAAGTTNSETWQEFLKSCRVQHEGGATAPAVAPAAQAAPAPSMHTIPAPPPTQTGQIPAPSATLGPVVGAAESASEQRARARCPSDTIVWVNNLTHVYHFPGVSSHGHSYCGNTSDGAYMCEADAKSVGNRAAKDEKHP